ncbi:hypothetical protein K488DRAFT_71833 [Vararia minispora EC-137]|uniref:Uncharacterized protein n=1 Tax=Vararia minispora EC-137 TaxID=1314806 RepID=A0ACB8QH59_9AGAM|nr:hypothetical protein K488DRAFT_71833 [Vararia minispora EC-137]
MTYEQMYALYKASESDYSESQDPCASEESGFSSADELEEILQNQIESSQLLIDSVAFSTSCFNTAYPDPPSTPPASQVAPTLPSRQGLPYFFMQNASFSPSPCYPMASSMTPYFSAAGGLEDIPTSIPEDTQAFPTAISPKSSEATFVSTTPTPSFPKKVRQAGLRSRESRRGLARSAAAEMLSQNFISELLPVFENGEAIAVLSGIAKEDGERAKANLARAGLESESYAFLDELHPRAKEALRARTDKRRNNEIYALGRLAAMTWAEIRFLPVRCCTYEKRNEENKLASKCKLVQTRGKENLSRHKHNNVAANFEIALISEKFPDIVAFRKQVRIQARSKKNGEA